MCFLGDKIQCLHSRHLRGQTQMVLSQEERSLLGPCTGISLSITTIARRSECEQTFWKEDLIAGATCLRTSIIMGETHVACVRVLDRKLPGLPL